MVTTPFRGEHWEVSYGIEGTYGAAPSGTHGMSRFLGLFERGQMPDPEVEFTPIYGAGGEQARRPIRTYRGRWQLQMNVSDILMLDGKALGLAIGNTYTVAKNTADDAVGNGTFSSDTAAGVTTIATSNLSASTGDAIQLGTVGSDNGVANECEIVIAAGATSGNSTTITTPTLYAHADGQVAGVVTTTGAGFHYRHTIVETTALPSIAVQASFWRAGDAAASPELVRQYLGGKVGRASMRVEEGEMARLNLDEITFADMKWNHTSGNHTADISVQGYDNALARVSNITLPTTEPYYFSGGKLQLDGTTIETVRSFGLEFGQNVEAKYYISGHDPAVPRPRLALEGRREYTMTMNVDPQNTDQYKELVREGLRVSGSNNINTGLSVLMEFQRDSETNAFDSKDKITIMCPGSGGVPIDDPGKGSAYTTADPTESNQGAYIRRGRIDITGDPVQNQELELMARQISVVVLDQDSWAV